jgi:2-dehydropantoate 2-reductase
MHHAILGPGGVGGLIAASLAESGDRVTVVVKTGALRQYPQNLKLDSPFGQFTVEVDRMDTVPPVDVLWIAVKATHLDESLMSLRSSNFPDAIVPLLNGIDHVVSLRERFGARRVVPATIRVESERIAPGHIVHRSPFAELGMSSVGRPLMEDTLAKLQRLGFACQFVDDETTLLWSKLVFLAPVALMTTAANKTTGEIAVDVNLKRQLETTVQEVCAVAHAQGARIDCESVISSIRGLPYNTRSSMQKDVDRGNMPELDAVAGPILRCAAQHNIDVRSTRELVALVEQRIRFKQCLPRAARS